MTWRDEAACRGMDPALFHTDDPRLVRDAKTVCATCPVRPDCLTYAIEAKETEGVWGGMDHKERRREARRRGKRSQANAPVRHVVCAWCGDPFATTHPRARYCGEDCVRSIDAQRQRTSRLRRTA